MVKTEKKPMEITKNQITILKTKLFLHLLRNPKCEFITSYLKRIKNK